MALQHDGEGLAGRGGRRRKLYRRGHQLSQRSSLGIASGKGQLAQYIAFGKNACHPAFTVDHAHGSDMPIQHHPDRVCRVSLNSDSCHILVT